MKKSSVFKLISSLTACIMCVSAAGFTASAEKDSSENPSKVCLNAVDVIEMPGGGKVYVVDTPAPEHKQDSIGIHTQKRSLNAGNQEFFDRCKGRSYGYEDLVNYRDEADPARSIYNGLYNFGIELWNSSENIVTEKVRIENTGEEFDCFKTIEVSSDMNYLTGIQTYFTFRNDNPIFYFYGMNAIAYPNGSLEIALEDDRYISAANRAGYQNSIKQYLTASEDLVTNDYTHTDFENAFELYKHIITGMSYARDNNGAPSEEPFAHNILGGIIDHSGVCESYAKVYRLLLNYNNIENIFITGQSMGEPHAWNLLKLDDGQYYYADSTWDDSVFTDTGSTLYFAKGSKSFTRDHTNDNSYNYIFNPSSPYLYRLPSTISSTDFNKNGDYRKTNPRLVDFNNDGSANNQDLKHLQKYLTKGSAYSKYFDMNGDGRLNNRDLKALQPVITSFQN